MYHSTKSFFVPPVTGGIFRGTSGCFGLVGKSPTSGLGQRRLSVDSGQKRTAGQKQNGSVLAFALPTQSPLWLCPRTFYQVPGQECISEWEYEGDYIITTCIIITL